MSILLFNLAANEVFCIELQPILIYKTSPALLSSTATNEKRLKGVDLFHMNACIDLKQALDG